jgi:hypothetical protein
MTNEVSNAYWDGFSAGYDDLPPSNPFNQENEKELHDAWEKGYEDGSRDC